MISTERATEIARSIVDARIHINVWGDATAIDNNLTGGIELAHAVASGYVSQLTNSGERRLTEAHKRITALRESLLTNPEPVESNHVECMTPDGTRLVLMRTDGEHPEAVVAHSAVLEDHREGDEPYASFIVTGAEWRDDINEQAPCMVGRWASYASAETFPMTSCGFQVYWDSVS